jgi:hypothetical protein
MAADDWPRFFSCSSFSHNFVRAPPPDLDHSPGRRRWLKKQKTIKTKLTPHAEPEADALVGSGGQNVAGLITSWGSSYQYVRVLSRSCLLPKWLLVSPRFPWAAGVWPISFLGRGKTTNGRQARRNFPFRRPLVDLFRKIV